MRVNNVERGFSSSRKPRTTDLKVSATFSLPISLMSRVKEYADDVGISVGDVATLAFETFLPKAEDSSP